MNIQKLKEIIWKANPSILELKFGCKIAIDSEHPDTYLFDIGDGSYELLDSDNKFFRWHGSIHPLQILGRPIRLADVLLAIGGRVRTNGWWIVNNNGEFQLHTIEREPRPMGNFYSEVGETKARWNLKDDNLDNQSDKCKQFLSELLTPSKG